MALTFHDYAYMFFWDFKRMDNTIYNFTVLEKLHEAKNNIGGNFYNKPIIIIIVSIIECILYDFIRRVTQHTNEKIPGLDPALIFFTRTKTIDDLEPILRYTRKNDILQQGTNTTLYDDLDTLRIIRNRVHIQNRKNQLHKDEDRVWSSINLNKATNALEAVCEIMCYAYIRPDRTLHPYSGFPRPWV